MHRVKRRYNRKTVVEKEPRSGSGIVKSLIKLALFIVVIIIIIWLLGKFVCPAMSL